MSVLPLMKKEAIWTAHHLNTEEVVQRTQVLDGELSAKTSRELTEETSHTCRQDDVVDIEQQVGRVRAVMIDERGVRAGRAKPKLVEKHRDALVPSARSLLESIQGPRKQAHLVGGAGGAEEAEGTGGAQEAGGAEGAAGAGEAKGAEGAAGARGASAAAVGGAACGGRASKPGAGQERRVSALGEASRSPRHRWREGQPGVPAETETHAHQNKRAGK